LQDEKDPAWLYYVFRPDGSRRVLKTTPEGNCTFLAPDGCRLPIHIRPIICRLHPFEYNAGGFYNDFAPGCPVDMLEPGRLLSSCFEMDPAEATCWHKMLYEEIVLEKKI
jgi:Fe-S-cluster containining protein